MLPECILLSDQINENTSKNSLKQVHFERHKKSSLDTLPTSSKVCSLSRKEFKSYTTEECWYTVLTHEVHVHQVLHTRGKPRPQHLYITTGVLLKDVNNNLLQYQSRVDMILETKLQHCDRHRFNITIELQSNIYVIRSQQINYIVHVKMTLE